MRRNTLGGSSVAIAASIAAATGMAVPTMASADLSASVGVANMYLWRGLNLTPDAPQVHGGIEYGHESGFYAGAWATSESQSREISFGTEQAAREGGGTPVDAVTEVNLDESGGHETDLYFGYGGSAGEFRYDISYWLYLYPEDGTHPDDGLFDQDLHELILSVGYGPISAAAYIQTEAPEGTPKDEDENNYFTITGEWQSFSLTFGIWDLETPGSGTTPPDEYSHLTFMYSATDELSLGVSVAFSDLDDDAGVEENPLFFVGYDLSFDIGK